MLTRIFLIIGLLFSTNAHSVEQYWNVSIFNTTPAEFDAIASAIEGIDKSGVDGIVQSETSKGTKIGVGGPNLSAFKPLLRAAVLSALGRVPDFDVDREDPDEMDPESRVCAKSDLNSGFDEKIPAYFGSYLRGLGDTPYINWLEPGNSYCQTRTGLNCDGTAATEAAVTSAIATWANMNQCNRWRIRLHHEGQKWDHDTLAKVHVYFADVPSHRVNALRQCLTPTEFEYLGLTRDEACAKLNDRQAGLCERFTGF